MPTADLSKLKTGRNYKINISVSFVCSGFLVAYLTLKTLKKHEGKINWLNRFIR